MERNEMMTAEQNEKQREISKQYILEFYPIKK